MARNDLSLHKVKVCGIIVLFNPTNTFVNSIESAIGIVDLLVIMDNSTDSAIGERTKNFLSRLHIEESSHPIVYMKNEMNVGLAESYNRAIQVGCAIGMDYFLILDQDTQLDVNTVRNLISYHAFLSKNCKVGAIGCVNLDASTSLISGVKDLFFKRRGFLETSEVKEILTPISSGLFVGKSVLLEVGKFNGDLFVDAVDTEFGLRLLSHGFRNFLCKRCVIQHTLGYTKKVHLMGKTFTLSLHDPIRTYYLVRDSERVAFAYFPFLPAYWVFVQFNVFVYILKALVFSDRKREHLRMLFEGARDFFRSPGLLGFE